MSRPLEPVDLRDAFFGTVHEIARQDPDVVFLTADMGAWSLSQFREELPGQFYNTGISEQNMVSVAAGLALNGKRPFVYAIAPFLALRCLEQIKVDVCTMELPVSLVGGGPGLTYASDGPTHHALEDLAAMRALPHMAIYNPSDPATASAAARLAYRDGGPCYIRVDKGALPFVHGTDEELCEGVVVLRTGCDVLLVASGTIVHTALAAAQELDVQGISASVIDVFKVKPLHSAALVDCARAHSAVVTIEEHMRAGGVGSAVCEALAEADVQRPVCRLGTEEYCFRYGDREWMRSHYGLDVGSLVSRITSWLPKRPSPRNQEATVATDALELAAGDFARLVGASVHSLPDRCTDVLTSSDFRYRQLPKSERDRVILDVLSRLDSGRFSVTGQRDKWERGWGENLREFAEHGFDLESLTPKYVREGLPIRLLSDYVRPLDPEFELNWYTAFRWWFFTEYMADVDEIFEFGCGPAYNLPMLAELYPGRKLYGLDWAEASCLIVAKLREVHGINVTEWQFDMFAPDEALPLREGSGVLTLGALEQLGDRFTGFIDYLCRKAPRVCAHMEPLRELYDEENLLDYLAKRFHLLRGYLGDLVAYLEHLQKRGQVEILKVHRVPVGSLFHEGYSYVVWRPVRGPATDKSGSAD